MAQVFVTDVYDFGSAGNRRVAKTQMGLPVHGMVVNPIPPFKGPDLSHPYVYVYSAITYPFSGNTQKFYSAETVAQIVTKANA